MTDATRSAAMRRALLLSQKQPLTVSQVAEVLGAPGAWTIRRLEKKGALPPARRSLVHRDRLYPSGYVAAMQRAIRGTPKTGDTE